MEKRKVVGATPEPNCRPSSRVACYDEIEKVEDSWTETELVLARVKCVAVNEMRNVNPCFARAERIDCENHAQSRLNF